MVTPRFYTVLLSLLLYWKIFNKISVKEAGEGGCIKASEKKIVCNAGNVNIVSVSNMALAAYDILFNLLTGGLLVLLKT